MLLRYADNWKAILAMTLVVSVVLCTASMVLLPKMLGKAILYLFFSSALYVQPLIHPSSIAFAWWLLTPTVTHWASK